MQFLTTLNLPSDVQVLPVSVAKGLGDGGLCAKQPEKVVKDILHGGALLGVGMAEILSLHNKNFLLDTEGISDDSQCRRVSCTISLS